MYERTTSTDMEEMSMNLMISAGDLSISEEDGKNKKRQNLANRTTTKDQRKTIKIFCFQK